MQLYLGSVKKNPMNCNSVLQNNQTQNMTFNAEFLPI